MLGSVARVRPPRSRSAGDVVASHRQSCRKFPRTVPSEGTRHARRGHVGAFCSCSVKDTRAPRGPRRPDAMATFTSASRLHAAACPPARGRVARCARSPSPVLLRSARKHRSDANGRSPLAVSARAREEETRANPGVAHATQSSTHHVRAGRRSTRGTQVRVFRAHRRGDVFLGR